MCRVLKVSRSDFHAFLVRPIARRRIDDLMLVQDIQTVFNASRRTYGSPRVLKQLHKNGKRVGKNRVARLMAKMGLKVCMKRKYHPITNSETPIPSLRILSIESSLERDQMSCGSPL